MEYKFIFIDSNIAKLQLNYFYISSSYVDNFVYYMPNSSMYSVMKLSNLTDSLD